MKIHKAITRATKSLLSSKPITYKSSRPPVRVRPLPSAQNKAMRSALSKGRPSNGIGVGY